MNRPTGSPLAVDGDPDGLARLAALADDVRALVLRSVAAAKAGHIGGPLSVADLLVALYFSILRVRPDEPAWVDRDRVVHSKGHAAIALYATLARRGYFPVEELGTFDQLDSRLQGHPDMTLLPGLDMSTGSLGMGLSAGVGMALGARLRAGPERTYVILGDGECQEGAVWEAAFIAARYGLDNLCAIVDVNRLQQYGWAAEAPQSRQAPWPSGALRKQWRGFGWRVLETNGHDMGQIISTLRAAQKVRGRPAVVLAHTIKGKGVSFMEGRYEWHARVPTAEELAAGLGDLHVD
jgi:transketolase